MLMEIKVKSIETGEKNILAIGAVDMYNVYGLLCPNLTACPALHKKVVHSINKEETLSL